MHVDLLSNSCGYVKNISGFVLGFGLLVGLFVGVSTDILGSCLFQVSYISFTCRRKEKAKKRRKLTRELREFTGVPSQGERRHKGWSDEGMLAFEKYVEMIRKDVEQSKYVAWEKAYREVMKKLGHTKNDDEDPLQQARYKPNLSVVYEGF
jgi:hypothetical protein